MQPVLLLPEAERLKVICGFRRVEAARAAGIAEIPSLICREWAPRQAVLVSLLERLSHEPLNDVERARAVDRFLRSGWSRQELALHLSPLLGIRLNEIVLEQLATLPVLSVPIQKRIALGEMHLYTACRLVAWGAHSERIAGWFAELRLGVNRQRELLDLMEEVTRACRTEPAELIATLEAMRDNQDPARTFERWLEHLKSRRYPRLTEAQRQFQAARSSLRLPQEIQLTAPPFFEENHFKVSFSFASREELECHARKLLEAAGTPEVAAILKLV